MEKRFFLLLLSLALVVALSACGSSSDTVTTDAGVDTAADTFGGETLADLGGGDTTCTPNCEGKKCSDDDGCGTPCGCASVDDQCCGDGTCQPADGECTCTPVCKDLLGNDYECGDNGCNGSCGDCDTGFVCEGHKCVESNVKIPFGAECKMLEDCQPYLADDTANPDYPFCNWDQCEDGVCNIPFCTKDCTVYKDTVNNATGATEPDGIEDADAPKTDCAGAVDGPVGTSFHCVWLTLPDDSNAVARCQAGSDFKACLTSADCPEGESCQLLYIYNELTLRCAAVVKEEFAGGKEVGESCNDNPFEGELGFCSDVSMCFGIGCVDYCKADTDCITGGATCTTGKCSNNAAKSCTANTDCSAFKCEQDFDIAGDGSFAADICFPKSCQTNVDCIDEAYHCTFFWNGEETVANADWEYLCVADVKDGVALGEQCDPYWQDGTNDPACENDFCMNGYCSAVCTVDGDCAEDQKCVAEEYPFDLNNDDTYDKILPYHLCSSFPGDFVECETNAECPEGEYCAKAEFPVEDVNATWQFEVRGYCATFEGATGEFGDFCGWGDGTTCKSGFCGYFDYDNGIGICTEYCNTNADCPASATIEGTEYGTRCTLDYYSWNGTLTDQTDDLFIGYCWVRGADESYADCSATMTCEKEGEACIAMPHGQNPDTTPSVEFVCIDASSVDDAGNPVVPTKNIGEECDPAANGECKTVYCMEGPKAGYCSATCLKNEDCGASGLVCAPRLYIDRLDDTKDLSFGLCQKDVSCVPCYADGDCINGRICVNVGGSGLTADYRCAPACADDTECGDDTTASTLCVESKDKNNKGEGKKACIGKANGWKC